MAINEVIKKRKSIRQYVEGAEVTDEQIRELLEAAQLAPSACNQRPWGFIVVQNKEVLAKIQAIHPFAQMLRTASAAIILTIDTDVKNSVSDGFFPLDAGAATQNILLQAAELGLGTCWCGVYPKEDKVPAFKKLFHLSDNIVPINVIAVGVPDEDFGSRGFYEEEKVTWIK